MTNFTSANRPLSAGLKRPSSGRRQNAKKKPVADETVPIYIQPFESNNAWSTLINVSPQSTVAEARKAIQSKLAEEQARPLEWWDYRARSPRGSPTATQREESPALVFSDEQLSDNMKLCELSSLKPYTTLKLERPNFISARRRRGSRSLVGVSGPTSGNQKSLAPISQSSSSRDSGQPALPDSASTTELAGSSAGRLAVEDKSSAKESGSAPPKMPIQEKASSQSTPEKVRKQEQDHPGVPNVPPVICEPVSLEEEDSKPEHQGDAQSTQRAIYEGIVNNVHLFQSMEVYKLEQLVDALKSESFGSGEVITNQGDGGDKFYIVQEGRLTALKEIEGQVHEVMTYEPGGYFGELALLYDQLSAVSVVTQTDCVLLAIDGATFKNLIGPLNALPDDNAVHTPPQSKDEFKGTCEELDEPVYDVEHSSPTPAMGTDDDDYLDELPTSYLDIGEMPLHSRPVSAQCQQDYPERPPRCESAMSTVVPSPSPVPFDSLPTSPSPVLGNFHSNHDRASNFPSNHDHAFQDLIKDLEAQVMRERGQREQLHKSFLHEQGLLAEERHTVVLLTGEMHELQKTFQEKCSELESDERQQRTVAAEALKELQETNDTFKDREGEWQKTKVELEQRCTQFQNRCWDLKEEQKAHEWRIEDQMQSEIQEVLRSEDQQCTELREQFTAELQAERMQIEDHNQQMKNELNVAHASHEATKAVQHMITFACLKITFDWKMNCKEAVMAAPTQPSEQETESPVVEGHDQKELHKVDQKDSQVENTQKEDDQSDDLVPLQHSQLVQQHPGTSLPSKEECNQLFPLQLSTLVQQHEDAAREQEVLKQECSELLPLLCQELGNLQSQTRPESTREQKSASSAVVLFDGGQKLQEVVPFTDHDQSDESTKFDLALSLEAEAERLRVLLLQREEETQLLQDKLTNQEALMQSGRKDLEAQGEILKNQIKQSKSSERHMRIVLFWSTYLCGCVCTTVGAVMYFVFREQ